MEETLKAFKFYLDPTPSQREVMERHAGTSRWSFNFALALKTQAHQQWRSAVDDLTNRGIAEAEARKRVKTPIPNSISIAKKWRETRDLPKEEGGCPWHKEISSYVFSSAFRDADAAWANWLSALQGKRAGRAVGYPRFKKKGRSKDSFRLHHDVKKPAIRLNGYRRLRIPRIGEVRMHESGKRMSRLIDRGQAVVQSVTVSRSGDRWYASVLCKVQITPPNPTRRQKAAGRIGVDLGVNHLAALSQPVQGKTLVDNPRHLRKAASRLKKAQRDLARTQKGSQRRHKARLKVAKIHHEVHLRRISYLHQITKQLTTTFAEVALEDLNVSGMTSSAKGTKDQPGKKVRQKAGLNRSILDSSPGEFRQQVEYKAPWHGSKMVLVDRFFPSSKTCSRCGWQNPHLTLANRTFHCNNCGLSMNRDENAARNIAKYAVARDGRETKNARGVHVRPTCTSGQRTKKREGFSKSPQRSDPLNTT